MDLLSRTNDALHVNPPLGATEALSLHGSNWLWAVTAIFVIAFLGILVLCFSARESDRVFHILFTMTLLVGAMTYFAQSSDLGWTAVGQADHSSRQIFYARYVYWVTSFPSIALALGLLSGVSWTTIFSNILLTWLWVLTYLAGAYTATSYRCGFFAFGTFSWMILAMSTLNESREAAARSGVGRNYFMLAGWANLLWLLYPVAWGLSDGSHIIGVTASAIFFGVLDVLMVPLMGFAFVLFAKRWDFHRLYLDLGEHRFLPPEKK